MNEDNFTISALATKFEASIINALDPVLKEFAKELSTEFHAEPFKFVDCNSKKEHFQDQRDDFPEIIYRMLQIYWDKNEAHKIIDELNSIRKEAS